MTTQEPAGLDEAFREYERTRYVAVQDWDAQTEAEAALRAALPVRSQEGVKDA